MKTNTKKKDNFDDMLADTFASKATKTSKPNISNKKESVVKIENKPKKEKISEKKEEKPVRTKAKKGIVIKENTDHFQKVKKTTVSFYPTEHKIIDEILGELHKERGARGGFSDAVKIALRLCPFDSQKIARAWDKARAEDGRIIRHKKV